MYRSISPRHRWKLKSKGTHAPPFQVWLKVFAKCSTYLMPAPQAIKHDVTWYVIHRRIERLLSRRPNASIAPAAKVSFSNWASGSSSFPFIHRWIANPGHASLRSLDWRSKCAAACMCRIGSGEPRFPARFKLRSRHFRLHPHTSSGWTIPFRLGGGLMGHAWAPICS